MKNKLFYGWYIVFAGMAVCLIYSAIFTYGWTSFITPILLTFSWSVTELSLASTLRGFEIGVFNPVWGAAVDRYSLKKLMFFGVIFTGIGIFLISLAPNLWVYYAGFLVMGMASSAVTSMIPNTAIARWFRKDIGKANGIFYMGMGLGGMLVPVVTFCIDHFGWRETLAFSALFFVLLGAPLAFVFRRRPEDYGLHPDGKEPVNPRSGSAEGSRNTRIGEAVKMSAFWYLSVFILFQTAISGILAMYIMPYLEEVGVSRQYASMVVLMFTVVSVLIRVPLGIMADKFKKTLVVALTTGIFGASFIVLVLINGSSPLWMMIAFAILCGLGISGVLTLRMPILAEYFGIRNIGTIFGYVSIASTIGAIVSLPVTGWIFDTTHSYKPVLFGLIALSVVSIVLLLIMPSPGKSGLKFARKAVVPE